MITTANSQLFLCGSTPFQVEPLEECLTPHQSHHRKKEKTHCLLLCTLPIRMIHKSFFVLVFISLVLNLLWLSYH